VPRAVRLSGASSHPRAVRAAADHVPDEERQGCRAGYGWACCWHRQYQTPLTLE
jgi:hypothetical protein